MFIVHFSSNLKKIVVFALLFCLATFLFAIVALLFCYYHCCTLLHSLSHLIVAFRCHASLASVMPSYSRVVPRCFCLVALAFVPCYLHFHALLLSFLHPIVCALLLSFSLMLPCFCYLVVHTWLLMPCCSCLVVCIALLLLPCCSRLVAHTLLFCLAS